MRSSGTRSPTSSDMEASGPGPVTDETVQSLFSAEIICRLLMFASDGPLCNLLDETMHRDLFVNNALSILPAAGP